MRFYESYKSKESCTMAWDFFINYDSKINGLKVWSQKENARFNKKIYFQTKNARELFLKSLPNKINNFVQDFLNFDDDYETPWKREKIGPLERIQIIESGEYKSENNKGEHLYNFHVDRINTYKKMLYCSNVDVNSGPFEVADINIIKDEASKIIKKIDTAHKLNKDFRKINATLSCRTSQSITGKTGDVIVIDGREPHRAGKVGHKGARKVIIFEYMTAINSHIYQSTFKN